MPYSKATRCFTCQITSQFVLRSETAWQCNHCKRIYPIRLYRIKAESARERLKRLGSRIEITASNMKRTGVLV